MFKYISEILSQFTQTQRILALLSLLLSIIILYLGPTYINTITLDNDELTTELNNQKTINFKFKNGIDSLNQKIIDNQIKCTNKIIERETEILGLIDGITRKMNSTKMGYKTINKTNVSDTSGVVVSEMVIVSDPRPEIMIIELNKIKSNIQTDINKRME